jgi:DNA-binding NarL/FixJ family response regulator
MKNTPPIKVFIADDHQVLLRGLRIIIDSEPSMKIIGEADNGDKALLEIERLLPDVAILDLSMPEKSGFDIVRELNQKKIPTKIVFLTMHDEEATLHTALDLGVKGYILKDSAINEIVKGVKTVHSGKNFISPSMSDYLVSKTQRGNQFSTQKPSINQLTPTEKRILLLISEHKTTREIADKLFVSHRTVDRHRYNICNKLEIKGVNSLLKFAIANKKNFS